MGIKKQDIRPFKGLRYDFSVVGEPALQLAPPYDVISPDQQDQLYAASPHNIVRLILGKQSESDTENDNRYTRSAADLEKWIASGALKRDDKPAIYVYAQTYTVSGDEKTRIGFIARKRLEEFGGSIVPHEKTLSGPKTDRLNLTRACRCNFSQIFGLYTDSEKKTDALLAKVVSTPADADVTTSDGLRHRMWAVTDEAWIDEMADTMQGKSVLIADGHHRYETALNYWKESAANGNDSEDVQHVMMYFTNTESEGLSILPTHRLVFNLGDDFDLDSFLASLAPDFKVESIPSNSTTRNDDAEKVLNEKMASATGSTFGLYSGNGVYHLLSYVGSLEGGPLDRLDVGVLHNKILEAKLGIGQEQLAAQSHVKYSQEIAPTAAKVDTGDFRLAFFLNPTPVEHMRMVTDAGLKMPQKSTYFYPKLVSGLVINPLY